MTRQTLTIEGGHIEIIRLGNTLWIQQDGCCVLRVNDFTGLEQHGVEVDTPPPATPATIIVSTEPVTVKTLDDAQRQHTLAVLQSNNWNKSATCRTLGIERSTLDRKLRKWGVSQPAAS